MCSLVGLGSKAVGRVFLQGIIHIDLHALLAVVGAGEDQRSMQTMVLSVLPRVSLQN